VSSRFRTTTDTFFSQGRQGLWVPAFAGTTRCESSFSRHDAPEFCEKHSPKRKEGAGKRRVAAAPAARVQGVKHTAVTTGTPDTRHSPRNGFNGLFRALPGDEFLLSPSSVDLSAHRNPVGLAYIHKLDTSNGCQDHTALPYAATFTIASCGHVLPLKVSKKALKRRSS